MKITRHYYLIFALLTCYSCDLQELSDIHLGALSYFNNLEYSSIRIENEVGNSSKSYYLDNNKKGVIFWNETNVFGKAKINIPEDFILNQDKSGENVKHFENAKNERILFNYLKDKSTSSLSVFKGVYQYSLENKIDFKIKSAKFIKTKWCDYVIYDVITLSNDKQRHSLGIIYTKHSLNYFDLSFSKESEITDFERVVFVDMINSFSAQNKLLIPLSNEIYEELNIEI